MKVIFLDFNGVLDTFNNMDEINPDNLNRLKKIVMATNSKIVISSSLKNSYYYTGVIGKKLMNVIKTLETNDIEVIGLTPLADNRELEIEMFLDDHDNIENFCIIDDDYDMPTFKEHLIKLKPQQFGGNGLEDKDVEKTINILNKEKQKVL